MALVITELVSDSLLSICLCGVVTLATSVLLSRRWNRSGRSSILPMSGPPTLPFFGNALSLKEHDEFLNQLNEWGRDYGPVYPLYVGRKLLVVVNGWNAIKEATVQAGLDFGDRPESVWMKVNPQRLGIFDTPANENWKNQRKFCHTTLRGMGFGKVSLEPLIQHEVNGVIEYFKRNQGTPMNPQVNFVVSSYNIISKLIFDRRTDHESDSADELMENVRALMILDGGPLLTLFPFMWHVMKYTARWRAFTGAFKDVTVFINDEIRSHQERLDASIGEPEINDFIDAFLVHRKTDPDNYTLSDLHMVIMSMFLGGSDTVSTTMTWATIFMATNPEIQNKIHDEIMKEIGTSQVSLSHRSGLPYTQAALLEVLRLSTVAPLVPRQANTDAILAGYNLPKGTELLLNMWSLHHDPDVWSNPMTFNPERFLAADGTLLKPDNFLPFSAGKRVCIGQSLAKLELFLFFTSMVQQLKFSVPPGHETPSYDGVLSLMREPKPFNIQMVTWSS